MSGVTVTGRQHMRAFVTGATGFLGRHLVEHLLAQGDEVTALVRTFDRARALPAGVRPHPGDILRPASLRGAVAGTDVVYHLAAVRRPGRRASDLDRLDNANVNGTRAVLTLAGELGVGRVVHISDLAVYGDTRGRRVDEGMRLDEATLATPYARSKHRAHLEAEQARRGGLPIIIVCPGALVGSGDAGWLGRLIGRYARGRLWVGVGGESAYGFVSVRDAATGLRLAAARGAVGETYFLAGPRLTLRQLLAEARRATGLPGPRVWLPSALARLFAGGVERMRPDLAEAASHFAGHTYLGDPAKTAQALDWQAAPLDEALREAVNWHQEQERLAQEAARLRREQETAIEP